MSSKNPSADEPESERPERGPTDHSYTAHKIHQNGRDIYYTTIPIDDLFPYSFVERFCENPEQGYQRRYDKRRALDIAQYLATEGESIPSNIVLSAQAIAELTYTRKSKQLNFQRVPEALAVIDGQHRLWGYHLCKLRHRVPVAIYSGLDQATEARLFLDINTKHKGVPKELLKNVKSIAGTETEIEANLRRMFQFLNTDEASPLRGKLNVGESSPGKLSRISFDSALGRAQKSELLSKQPPDKQQELVLNYLRAFHGEIDDKEQLVKRNYFGAMFDVFDEVVRKAKKELSSVKLPALETVVSLFSDITESDYTGPAKRQRIVEEMRNRLNSDIRIDPEDI